MCVGSTGEHGLHQLVYGGTTIAFLPGAGINRPYRLGRRRRPLVPASHAARHAAWTGRSGAAWLHPHGV